MIVQDVVTLARHGELSSVAVKDDPSAIVSFVNLGMIALYKIFTVDTRILEFTPEENDLTLILPPNFMYPIRSYQKVKEGNKLKEKDVPINEEDCAKGINFLNYKEVNFSSELIGKTIYIRYNVSPPKYTHSNMNEEIALPETLIDCLLHYVGYRGHLGIRSDGNSETNVHFVRFERSVEKAKNLGIVPTTDSLVMNKRIRDRGFA